MFGIGTLYLIPLLIFSGTKTKVRDMGNEDINEISMALRVVKSTCAYGAILFLCSRLPDDPTLQPFVERIVDCILRLRQLINFQMHTLADTDKCEELGIPEVISSSEVEETDIFFEDISFRYVYYQLSANGD